MKTSKKPSILDERSDRGLADELDEYGVWVKSEPEDLLHGGDGIIGEVQRFNIDDDADALSTAPEFSAGSRGASGGFDGESGDPAENAPLNLDDFDDPVDFAAANTAPIETDEAPAENDELNAESLDFDDFLTQDDVAPAESENADAESGFDEEIPLELEEESAEVPDGEQPMDAFDLGGELETETVLEVETGGDIPVEEEFIEAEFNAPAEGELVEAEFGAPVEEALTETDFDAPVAEEFAETDFDVQTEEAPSASQAQAEENGVATELLLKIANELSSIKYELDTLKSEISEIRSGGSHGAAFNDESETLTNEELCDVLENADVTSEVAETPADAADALSSLDDFGADDAGGETISLTSDELAELDDVDENLSLTSEELTKLDEIDESIALTGEELTKLGDADETIALTDDELKRLDSVDVSAHAANEAEGESETLTGDELTNILSTSDLTEEIGIDIQENITPPPDAQPESAAAANEAGDENETLTGDELANILKTSDLTEETGIDIQENIAPPPDAQPESALDSAAPPLNEKFKNEICTVLAYMDQLLEALPEEKIEEFARSDKFDIYKKVFKDLGLV